MEREREKERERKRERDIDILSVRTQQEADDSSRVI